MEIGTRVRVTQNTSGCPALDSVVGESGKVTLVGTGENEGFIGVRLDDPSKDPLGPIGWGPGFKPGVTVLKTDEVEVIDGEQAEEAREQETVGATA